MYLPKKGFPGKLSEFSIFLAWPAILDIYSHGLLYSSQFPSFIKRQGR